MKKIIVFLLSASMCYCINSQTIDDLRRYYNYDPSEDLNYRVIKTTDTTLATILNIQYTGGNDMMVTAYLIIPKNNLRRYPAVIFLHGTCQDKNAFLTNALALARNSFASLLIDDPPALPVSQKMNYQNYSEPAKELLVHRQSVINVRRGIDLLEQHPKIDGDRIAFTGIEYGAWTGAIVAGVEFRILTYILINCPSQPSSELRNSNEPGIVKKRNAFSTEQIDLYESITKKLDPEYYLPYHRNSTILFQFSEEDSTVVVNTHNKLFNSASQPKTIFTYKAPVFELINLTEALQARNKWLNNHL
jgi:hypothetical protein